MHLHKRSMSSLSTIIGFVGKTGSYKNSREVFTFFLNFCFIIFCVTLIFFSHSGETYCGWCTCAQRSRHCSAAGDCRRTRARARARGRGRGRGRHHRRGACSIWDRHNRFLEMKISYFLSLSLFLPVCARGCGNFSCNFLATCSPWTYNSIFVLFALIEPMFSFGHEARCSCQQHHLFGRSINMHIFQSHMTQKHMVFVNNAYNCQNECFSFKKRAFFSFFLFFFLFFFFALSLSLLPYICSNFPANTQNFEGKWRQNLDNVSPTTFHSYPHNPQPSCNQPSHGGVQPAQGVLGSRFGGWFAIAHRLVHNYLGKFTIA